MNLKIKNYVIEESKTFTYVLKDITKNGLSFLLDFFVSNDILFSFNMNTKSNTLSFYVNSLFEFNRIKNIIKNKFPLYTRG